MAEPMRVRLAPPGWPRAKKRGNFSIARSLNNGTEVTCRHRRKRARPRERVNACMCIRTRTHICTRAFVSVCDDRDASGEREREIERERERESVRIAGQRLPKIIPSAAGKTQFPSQNLMIDRPTRQELIGFPGAAN